MEREERERGRERREGEREREKEREKGPLGLAHDEWPPPPPTFKEVDIFAVTSPARPPEGEFVKDRD